MPTATYTVHRTVPDEVFRARWSNHEVRFHRTGTKRTHHPAVGDLEFTFEGLELPDSPGLVMYAYTTAAGSPSEKRIRLLGSLAATPAWTQVAALED